MTHVMGHPVITDEAEGTVQCAGFTFRPRFGETLADCAARVTLIVAAQLTRSADPEVPTQ